MALVNKQAAIMIKDSEAKLNLIGAAFDLLNDKTLSEKLSKNIKAMAITNAAERIVDEILKVAKQ
jgi:UDP-N-acetylglucosamine--N-acetylmuramyl-(pentapeptide) pyrophosphoryl-undecaprenol N-acetylglucosamine transferase